MMISTDCSVASLRVPSMPAFPTFAAVAAFRAADAAIPADGGHKLATRNWEMPPPRARMHV
jgi:hypothetical protein